MKSFFKLILVAFLTLAGFQTKAQSTFQLTNVIAIDTIVNYSDTVRIVSMLEYTGVQQSFFDTLQIGCQTIINGTIKTFVVPTFGQVINVQQPAGGVDLDTIRIPVSSLYFSDGGGHTVIVWPIINNSNLPTGTDIDSTTIAPPIIVTSWLNQEEWATEKRARIFPVPANDYIMLEKPEGKANISIIDIQGRTVTVLYSTEKQIRIPLSHLPKGTYFLQYTDGMKPAEIHSFIKE